MKSPKQQANTFGIQLNRQRCAAGMTQDELATASGISRASISLYERLIKEPCLDYFRRLAKALADKADMDVDVMHSLLLDTNVTEEEE